MTAGEQAVFSTQLQSACEGRTQGASALLGGSGLKSPVVLELSRSPTGLNDRGSEPVLDGNICWKRISYSLDFGSSCRWW